MTRKYPLEPLKRVREQGVDEGARKLSRALGEVEKARDVAERRAKAKQDLERSLEEVARGERAKLEKGDLTVADLARGAAFDVAGAMKRAAHERAAVEARQVHARAVGEADERRRDLADARTQAELVEKHHDRWQKGEVARSTAREDESAEEAYLARGKGGRGGS